MKILLISNYKALASKYGMHTETILARIEDLISHDRDLGIDTRLAYVDSMGLPSATDVTDPGDPAQNKEAVDVLITTYIPDYTVLLGAQDIIPFQQLQDPVPPVTPGQVNYFPSDLPYACDAGYSQDITVFLNPSRKITRLPDVYGPLSQDGLEAFIKTLYYAGNIVSSDISLYRNWWNACTTKRTNAMYAIKNYFSSRGIKFHIGICPPCTDSWDVGEYERMVHHHILHGARNDNRLYGESSDIHPRYPTAVSAWKTAGYLREGMILLECACHGAQLYPTSDEQSMPLANIYLASGGIVLGSTTVTYSSTQGMNCRDYLVCRFMEKLLDGQDIGTALLTARRDLVQNKGASDPVLRKILGEYNAYGYPTLCPISSQASAVSHTSACEKDNISEQELIPVSCQTLSKVPETVQKYIMHYLFTQGFRYAADNPPEIRGFTSPAPSEAESGQITSVNRDSCYAVSARRNTSTTYVYVFHSKGESVTYIEEYETDQDGLLSR